MNCRFSYFKLEKAELEKLKAEYVAEPRNFKADLIFQNNQCYPIQPFPICNWKYLQYLDEGPHSSELVTFKNQFAFGANFKGKTTVWSCS